MDAPPTRAQTRSWLGATLLVAAVLLTANAKLVVGAAAPKWDGDEFFGPYFTLVADHARAGRLLLWDPWTSGGAPDFADPQLGTFSPLTVLVGAVTGGSEAGFRAYWLLLWLLGPLGVLALGRHLGAPAWGGAVVALGFAFSGFYTGHAEHTSLLYPTAFLPFVLWRLDAALASRRVGPAAQAGALWGLSALGGYPALPILTGGFAGLWALGRWGCPEPRGNVRGATAEAAPRATAALTLPVVLRALAVFLAVGVLVLSPPYVAFFLETAGYSDRVGPLPREVAVTSNALHPGALATFASPYLAVLKLHQNALWPLTDVSTASVYVGGAVLVLAALALAARPSRWRWWLAGAGLFLLASTLGAHLPLRGWLYDLLPPLRYFRHPGFLRVYPMLTAAVLALLATRDLEAARGDAGAPVRRRLVAVAAAAAAAAAVAYAAVLLGVDKPGDALPRAHAHLVVVWLGLIAAVVAGRRRGALLPWLIVILAVADAALTASLAHPTVYDTGRARRVWDRINATRSAGLDLTPNGLRREPRAPGWLGGPLNNKNLPLKIATLRNFVALQNRFHADAATRPLLAAAATGEQRIWFAREVAAVSPTDAVYAAVVRQSDAVGAPVLVIHARAAMARLPKAREPGPRDAEDALAVGRLPAAERVVARVLDYRPEQLALEATCPATGWLLVTDRWSAGWRATVNGIPTDVLAGNFVFRAVPVRPGPNEVRFVYRPAGWPWLLLASWGALAAVAVTTVRPRRTGATP